MPQRSNSNRGRNNNPEGRNQYSNGWIDTAKDHPLSTAAAAAGAAAAGVFLWSKRNRISDQMSRLSDQISDWTQNMHSRDSGHELAMTDGPNESSAIESSRKAGPPSAKARRTSGRATQQAATM